MKKSKILLSIIVLVFCSGCTVNYDLNINRINDISENVMLSATDGNDIAEFADFNSYIPIDKNADDSGVFDSKVDGVEYYTQKINSSSDKLLFSYNHTNFNTFSNDYITNNAYKYVTITRNDDSLILSTSKLNLAFDRYDNLDEVVVTITSRYKLIETNADSSEKYKYTWTIDRSNYDDKYLYLSLDTSERKNTLTEDIEEMNLFAYLPLIIIIVVIVVAVWLFIKRSEKKNQV